MPLVKANTVRLQTSEDRVFFHLDGVVAPLDRSLLFWTVGDMAVYYNLPTGRYTGNSHLLAEYFAIWYDGVTYRFRREDVVDLENLYDLLESWA